MEKSLSQLAFAYVAGRIRWITEMPSGKGKMKGPLHHKTPIWIGVLAWVVACLVLGLMVVIGLVFAGLTGPSNRSSELIWIEMQWYWMGITYMAMFFTSAPSFVIVLLARFLPFPRGLYDVLAGFIVGAGFGSIPIVSTFKWETIIEPAEIFFLIWLGLMGAVTGFTYWIMANSLSSDWLKHHEESWLWGRRIS